MKYKLANIKLKFEALVIREKLLLVGAFVAFVYVGWDLAFIQPLSKELDKLNKREQVINKDKVLVQAELSIFEMALKNDPNASLKLEHKKLLKKLSHLDQGLKNVSVGLVRAENLPLMLHDVLKEANKLTLLSLVTLPTKEVRLDKLGLRNKAQDEALALSGASQKALPGGSANTSGGLPAALDGDSLTDEAYVKTVRLFRHGVNLKFSGTYQEVLRYISKLEQGKWRFYWASLGYKVQLYPKAEIDLQVYTLSSERGVFDGGS